MDNTILELLGKFIGMQNQQPNSTTQQNPSISSYPPEAFIQANSQPEQNAPIQNNQMLNMLSALMNGSGGNNPLALLSSLLGKNNPLANALSGGNKKEEEPPSSPKDEILL